MSSKSQRAANRTLISFFSRNKYHILICLLSTAVMVFLFLLEITPVRYDLQIGMVPNQTIAATKDVVDEITTSQKRQEAGRLVQPTYVYQDGITENVLYNLDQVFTQLKSVRQYSDTLPDISPSRVFSGEELAYARTILTLINLRDHQLTTLMRASPQEIDALYASIRTATDNTMRGHVSQGEETEAVQRILLIIGFGVDQNLLQNVAMPVLNYCIQANMVVDDASTQAARNEAMAAVEPVIYKQGQNIVVKGEGRITQNQLAMLSALGLLNDHNTDQDSYRGGIILVAGLMLILYLLIDQLEHHLLPARSLLILSMACILTFGLCMLGKLINSYLMPAILCGMLVSMLVSLKCGLICNAAFAVLISVLTIGGDEAYAEMAVLLFTTTFISGSVAILILKKARSSRLFGFITGLIAAGCDLVVCLCIAWMTSSDLNGLSASVFWRMGGSVIAALLFMGLVPLFELIFNLPTNYKLQDLSNPNLPLLKRLLVEAPGTYHHSIIVANLAEASAEAIGANPLLARVGGYFHDIGKLKRPSFFRENQTGESNPLDKSDPQASANIVIAHVRDGITMAKEAHFPKEVIQIIAEHHGDTPVIFFYHKALQMANGNQVSMDDFRYDGKPPSTKEGAIVMLCDTIEAAVRTLKSPTPESIESFIVKLVRGKIEDGQLSSAPLTLRDIDRICTACTSVLVGVFHERIEYPEMPKHTSSIRMHHKSADKKTHADVPEAPGSSIVVPQPVPEPVPVVIPKDAQPAPVIEPEDLVDNPPPFISHEQAEEQPKTEKADPPREPTEEENA